MSYDEYIASIEKLKVENESRIISVIPELENFAFSALMEWIDNSLDVKNGSFVANADTIAILNDFDSSFLKALTELESYKGAVTSFIKNLPPMAKAIEDFQTKTNGINWAKAEIGPTQKLVVSEIMNAYTDNGLNTNFLQPLRDQLYQNIASGTNVREAKSSLSDYIKSGKDTSGKLNKYLTQTAQQAVDSYTGAINKKLMDTFDFPYVVMSGSLIATSSPQCRYAINKLGGIFSMEDFENILKPIAEKNGLIPGTTFKNLDFNKLHWGCRHEFTPAMFKDGDQVGTHEDFINGKVEKINAKADGKIRKAPVNRPVTLRSDPLLTGPFKDLYNILKSKVTPLIRKQEMNKFLNATEHDVLFENKKFGTKIFEIQGAEYNADELASFKKLADAGQNVIIPNKGAFVKGANRNDAFIVDGKTYLSQAVDVKRISGSGSLETFVRHFDKAGQQANVMLLDITTGISPRSLMKSLRASWSEDISKVLIYYRGSLREITRDVLYKDQTMLNLLK